MGGGHWITKPFYDRDRLVRLVKQAKEKYKVEVWLEPGEAVAIHTGVLRATVMDVFESAGHKLAILDISATAHMPDVIEMPYRPDVYLVEKSEARDQKPDVLNPAVTLEGETYQLAQDPQSPISNLSVVASAKSDPPIPQSLFTYRLGGPTCLAGDVIGDYSFHRELRAGDTLVFDDMAHYTMVKTTTFNGVKHPPIALLHEDGRIETIRTFGYLDFRNRLS